MKIIFLTGHRKSGTTLLSNLLDNVNGLCVYPTDLTYCMLIIPILITKNIRINLK